MIRRFECARSLCAMPLREATISYINAKRRVHVSPAATTTHQTTPRPSRARYSYSIIRTPFVVYVDGRRAAVGRPQSMTSRGWCPPACTGGPAPEWFPARLQYFCEGDDVKQCCRRRRAGDVPRYVVRFDERGRLAPRYSDCPQTRVMSGRRATTGAHRVADDHCPKCDFSLP
jgi:hypothetical protein